MIGSITSPVYVFRIFIGSLRLQGEEGGRTSIGARVIMSSVYNLLVLGVFVCLTVPVLRTWNCA